MIVGIGTDIVKIDRIKRALERTEGFENRVFSTEEIVYCKSMARPEQHFAARFAAKEAAMKALGTGWSGGLRFQDICIVRDDNGAPSLLIEEPTKNLIQDCSRMKFWVSMSHDGDSAVATVLIERDA
jgi:holo-[acyl-carrier protein] synthase